jgi:hypothetical protein
MGFILLPSDAGQRLRISSIASSSAYDESVGGPMALFPLRISGGHGRCRLMIKELSCQVEL